MSIQASKEVCPAIKPARHWLNNQGSHIVHRHTLTQPCSPPPLPILHLTLSPLYTTLIVFNTDDKQFFYTHATVWLCRPRSKNLGDYLVFYLCHVSLDKLCFIFFIVYVRTKHNHYEGFSKLFTEGNHQSWLRHSSYKIKTQRIALYISICIAKAS